MVMEEFVFNVGDKPPSVRHNVWLVPIEEVPPLLFTVEQAARVLDVGRDQIYSLIRLGRLRSVKVGALRRISARALCDCVAELELESA
jgi:excisionase family DNA binding protein